ncbi:MAG: SprA-related family protein [Proteobacteria bacterium]|nr:SprA-related family protein [Desulfobacula sp.]MBU3952076.1 SprA-related family protein [Pseudomonadota bacterium]MBU4130307.1 SprA-related family protein [Pseudomonadota bacterium]
MNINTTTYNTYSPYKGQGETSLNPSAGLAETRDIPGQSSTAGNTTPPSSVRQDSRPNPATETEETQAGNAKEKQPQTATENQLTQAELQLVSELKQIDSEVRGHEMAHITAGGSLITSGASFTYKRGPDGQKYAVAGEVGIDTAPVPGDPQATLEKMRQVKSSAMAPASPSSQDLKVASRATTMASKALSELTILRAKEQAETNETQAFGNLKQASDAYTKVNHLPEKNTGTFRLAV